MGRILINLQLMDQGLPPIIIQNKSKHTEYYPLFINYPVTLNFNGFSQLFALLLQESLHKRITMLTTKKIVPLSVWQIKTTLKRTLQLTTPNHSGLPFA